MKTLTREEVKPKTNLSLCPSRLGVQSLKLENSNSTPRAIILGKIHICVSGTQKRLAILAIKDNTQTGNIL